MVEIIESVISFFQVVIKYAPKFDKAVIFTLQLSIFSILLGTVFGLFITCLKMTKLRIIQRVADVYISIVRGTPLLLQLFFMFYVLPGLGLELDRMPTAVIGLAFHSGAYISEIFRGAVESIHYGQEEAARALGMSKMQAFIHVVLPQAFKRSVPALGNQFIIAIKDSSLASTITIPEIILTTRQFASATFDPYPILFIAGVYYYVMVTGLTKLLKMLEKRLSVNER